MKDVLPDIDRWLVAGRQLALAKVVGIEGSGPREPGAIMVVNDQGEVAGSVSGGCVEGAVVAEALEAMAAGSRPRVVSFGYTDSEAWEVGLTCGGTIRVLVAPGLPPFYQQLRSALAANQPTALATLVEVEQPAQGTATTGPTPQLGGALLIGETFGREGGLGNPELDRVVERDALGALASGQSEVRHYGACGEAGERAVGVFIEVFAPPPRMLIFGAVDFTAALARVAKVLGYHVTVCDARSAFATRTRFPVADQVVVEWPHLYLERVVPELEGRDAICVLSHDPKFDVPALKVALRTGVGYIGAMGSRRTDADRRRRLADEGVDQAGLGRIMGPIGIDIGARTPEETAISICAEIIALRTGRPAPSLRDGDGAVHVAAIGSPRS